MKKIFTILCVLVFAGQANATCDAVPYKPVFNSLNDTLGWIRMSNQASAALPSYWEFRNTEAGNPALFPYLTTRATTPTNQFVRLYSPCITLDSNKKYELRFSVEGLTPIFMNHFRIWLATDAPGYTNNQYTLVNPSPAPGVAPPSDTFRLIKEINVPYGTTEVAALIADTSFFPQTGRASRNYRLVFESRNFSMQIPGLGGSNTYDIRSYLKNIELREATPIKMRVVDMSSPLPNCNLSDNQTMIFKVQNLGGTMPANYDVCYEISTNEGATFENRTC
ncbi:MAG: hypothetical protein LBP96_02680, partial [Bacteroidales bacterium]|nr:hypothetical protein [Bacteroidales bacterium]